MPIPCVITTKISSSVFGFSFWHLSVPLSWKYPQNKLIQTLLPLYPTNHQSILHIYKMGKNSFQSHIYYAGSLRLWYLILWLVMISLYLCTWIVWARSEAQYVGNQRKLFTGSKTNHSTLLFCFFQIWPMPWHLSLFLYGNHFVSILAVKQFELWQENGPCSTINEGAI